MDKIHEAKRRAISYEQTKKDVAAIDKSLDDLFKLKRSLKKISDQVVAAGAPVNEDDATQKMTKLASSHREMMELKANVDFEKAKVRYACYHILAEMEIW